MGSEPWLIVSNGLYLELSEDNMLAVPIRDTEVGRAHPPELRFSCTEAVMKSRLGAVRSADRNASQQRAAHSGSPCSSSSAGWPARCQRA